MGTVGLDFGSPTSGAGFNVSSTVSEIISNLQNVETPWKNQLTSLESQDTVISSLGSLLSNVSTDMSALTDANGVLAEKEGSSSDTSVLQLTAASSSAAAGTHTVTVNSLAQTSSGYLAEVASSSDTLSGKVTLQVGSGTPQTIILSSSNDTLAGLASAINASNVGITANVLTDATGSRLSLVSGTSGAAGDIIVSSNSLAAAASNTLSAAVTAGGGTGSSATASTALLAAVSSSGETLNSSGSLQVTVGNGSQQSISMSAVASATGGTTLSDLQQYISNNSSTLGFSASLVNNSDGTVSLQLTSGATGSTGTLAVSSSLVDPATALSYTNTVAGTNANLTVDGVDLTSASNTITNLIPGVTFQLLGTSAVGSEVQVVIGNDNTGVESAVNQFVSDYNSLISAVNAQEGDTSSGTAEPLFGSPTLSLLQQELLNNINTENPNGYIDQISSSSSTILSGSLAIQVGSNTAENVVIGAAPATPAANTVYTGSGINSIGGLAAAINSANIGVTANVVTSGGGSTLTFTSQTAGSSGALTVTSALSSVAPTPVTFTDTGYTSTTGDYGTLGSVADANDTFSGTFSIQVGSGKAQTITLTSSDNTLSGLMGAINGLSGVSATFNKAGTGLIVTSGTDGANGALTVTSNLADTTSPTTTALNYNSSSDINNLTTLGISVNNDGSLTFDATSLDSVLNTDYSSVASFFQNANSWGLNFSNMLTNAGSSSSSGILGLAASADSTTESTLNAEITKENSYISAQQSSLTTELNTANQVLEELPTELQGINELYSAITGYNQGSGGA
jgi:flagellar hook-associated protein 2